MQLGMIGLGRMGGNMAKRIAAAGHEVVGYDRSPESDRTVASLKELVAALKAPRLVWVMVPAGEATDSTINELAELLQPGDMIIDGGNSRYTDDARHAAELEPKGIHFMDCGVSGGVWGIDRGYALMVGGNKDDFETARPIFEALKPEGDSGLVLAGPVGGGHFAKMVHNGIEYSDMQLISESYDLMRRALGMTPAEIGDVFEEWNKTELDSYLIEITAEVLHQVDKRTGKPLVDLIVDHAGMKGTGTWTVQTALSLAVPVTGIAEAVFARGLSSEADLRDEAQKQGFAGPDGKLNLNDDEKKAFIEDIRQALYASKIVAYAQGFNEITTAAKEYGWDIDLAAVARIWRGGCIIRAKFLNRISEAFESGEANVSLLFAPYFKNAIENAEKSWRNVVAQAAINGLPTPAFASSLSYFDGLRSKRLPAALIQGQRDYFGAHTYQRVDQPGAFHTLWAEPGREEIEA
mgnify:CR=1 FL=1